MKVATMVSDPKDGLPVEQTVPAKEAAKSELLDFAVKAHGGLDRWNKVKEFSGQTGSVSGKRICICISYI